MSFGSCVKPSHRVASFARPNLPSPSGASSTRCLVKHEHGVSEFAFGDVTQKSDRHVIVFAGYEAASYGCLELTCQGGDVLPQDRRNVQGDEGAHGLFSAGLGKVKPFLAG